MAKKSTTIRIEAGVHKAAIRRVNQLGFKTFSEYLDTLLRIDLEQTPTLHLVRNEKGTHYFNEPIKPKGAAEKRQQETDSIGLMKSPGSPKKRTRGR